MSTKKKIKGKKKTSKKQAVDTELRASLGQGRLEAAVNEAGWRAGVYLVVEDGGVSARGMAQHALSRLRAGGRPRVKALSAGDLLAELARFRKQKSPVPSPDARFYQEAARCLAEKGKISDDIMAKLIKLRLLTLKEESINTRNTELSKSVQTDVEQADTAPTRVSRTKKGSKAKGKSSGKSKADAKEKTKPSQKTDSGKAKDKKKLASQSSKTSKTSKASKSSKASKTSKSSKTSKTSKTSKASKASKAVVDIIVDWPRGGPQLYLILFGFYESGLASNMIRAGIPLTAIIKISSAPTPKDELRSKDRRTSGSAEKVEVLLKKKKSKSTKKSKVKSASGPPLEDLPPLSSGIISEFWKNFTESLKNDDDSLILKDVALSELSAHNELADSIQESDFRDLINVVYDLEYFQQYHKLYLSNMSVCKVEVVEHPVDLQSMTIYNQDISMIPAENITVSFIIQCMLNQVEKSLEKELNTVNESMLGLKDNTGENRPVDLTPTIIFQGDLLQEDACNLPEIATSLYYKTLSILTNLPVLRLWDQYKPLEYLEREKYDYHIDRLHHFSCREEITKTFLCHYLHITCLGKILRGVPKQKLLMTKPHQPRSLFKRRNFPNGLTSVKDNNGEEMKNVSFLSENDAGDVSKHSIAEIEGLRSMFDCEQISSLLECLCTTKSNEAPENVMEKYKFIEKMESNLMIQAICRAWESHCCMTHSYFKPSDVLLLHFFKGIATNQWRAKLGTPVGFKDFHEFVLQEEWTWLKNEEKKHWDITMLDKSTMANISSLNYIELLEEWQIFCEKRGLHKCDKNVEFDIIQTIKPVNILPRINVGYDVIPFRIQFGGNITEFSSPDGTKIYTELRYSVGDDVSLGMSFSKSNHTLTLNLPLAVGVHSENILCHVASSTGVIIAFYVNFCPKAQKPNSEVNSNNKKITPVVEDVGISGSKKKTSHKQKSVKSKGKAKTIKNITEEKLPDKPIDKVPVLETNINQPLGFNTDISVSCPSGLCVTSLSCGGRNTIHYIKQHYLQGITQEKQRCILKDGRVLKFLLDESIEILCPDGTTCLCKDFSLFQDQKYQINFQKEKTENINDMDIRNQQKDKDFHDQNPIKKWLVSDAFVTKIWGERYRIHKNVIADQNYIPVKTAVDHHLGEIFVKRSDGTTYFLKSDGELVVTFPDGTRISSMWTVEKELVFCEWTEEEITMYDLQTGAEVVASTEITHASEIKLSNGNARTQLSPDEGFVSVIMVTTIEHPSYAAVSFRGGTGKCTLRLPENVEVFLQTEGKVTVNLSSNTNIVTSQHSLSFISQPCESCDATSQTEISLICPVSEENENISDFSKTRDILGNTFIIRSDGSCSYNSTELASNKECNLSSNTKNVCPHRNFPQNRKCFVLHRDYSGEEILHEQDVENHLQEVKKTQGGSVHRYEVPSRPPVVVLNTFKPQSRKKWSMPYTVARPLPQHLSWLDLQLLPLGSPIKWLHAPLTELRKSSSQLQDDSCLNKLGLSERTQSVASSFLPPRPPHPSPAQSEDGTCSQEWRPPREMLVEAYFSHSPSAPQPMFVQPDDNSFSRKQRPSKELQEITVSHPSTVYLDDKGFSRDQISSEEFREMRGVTSSIPSPTHPDDNSLSPEPRPSEEPRDIDGCCTLFRQSCPSLTQTDENRQSQDQRQSEDLRGIAGFCPTLTHPDDNSFSLEQRPSENLGGVAGVRPSTTHPDYNRLSREQRPSEGMGEVAGSRPSPTHRDDNSFSREQRPSENLGGVAGVRPSSTHPNYNRLSLEQRPSENLGEVVGSRLSPTHCDDNSFSHEQRPSENLRGVAGVRPSPTHYDNNSLSREQRPSENLVGVAGSRPSLTHYDDNSLSREQRLSEELRGLDGCCALFRQSRQSLTQTDENIQSQEQRQSEVLRGMAGSCPTLTHPDYNSFSLEQRPSENLGGVAGVHRSPTHPDDIGFSREQRPSENLGGVAGVRPSSTHPDDNSLSREQRPSENLGGVSGSRPSHTNTDDYCFSREQRLSENLRGVSGSRPSPTSPDENRCSCEQRPSETLRGVAGSRPSPTCPDNNFSSEQRQSENLEGVAGVRPSSTHPDDNSLSREQRQSENLGGVAGSRPSPTHRDDNSFSREQRPSENLGGGAGGRPSPTHPNYNRLSLEQRPSDYMGEVAGVRPSPTNPNYNGLSLEQRPSENLGEVAGSRPSPTHCDDNSFSHEQRSSENLRGVAGSHPSPTHHDDNSLSHEQRLSEELRGIDGCCALFRQSRQSLTQTDENIQSQEQRQSEDLRGMAGSCPTLTHPDYNSFSLEQRPSENLGGVAGVRPSPTHPDDIGFSREQRPSENLGGVAGVRPSPTHPNYNRLSCEQRPSENLGGVADSRPSPTNTDDNCFSREQRLSENLRGVSGFRPSSTRPDDNSFSREQRPSETLRGVAGSRPSPTHPDDNSLSREQRPSETLRGVAGSRPSPTRPDDNSFSHEQRQSENLGGVAGSRPSPTCPDDNSSSHEQRPSENLRGVAGSRPSPTNTDDNCFSCEQRLSENLRGVSGFRPSSKRPDDNSFSHEHRPSENLRGVAGVRPSPTHPDYNRISREQRPSEGLGEVAGPRPSPTRPDDNSFSHEQRPSENLGGAAGSRLSDNRTGPQVIARSVVRVQPAGKNMFDWLKDALLRYKRSAEAMVAQYSAHPRAQLPDDQRLLQEHLLALVRGHSQAGQGAPDPK